MSKKSKKTQNSIKIDEELNVFNNDVWLGSIAETDSGYEFRHDVTILDIDSRLIADSISDLEEKIKKLKL